MYGFQKPEEKDYVVIIRYKDKGVQPMVIRTTSFESGTNIATTQLEMAKSKKGSYEIESVSVCKVELRVSYEEK